MSLTCKLVGEVFSGTGVAAGSLENLLPMIRCISGLNALQPGTLNVRLPQAHKIDPDFTLSASEYRHHENIFLQRCRVLGCDGLIMRTSTNHHGDAVLEIMAEHRLREKYGLKDGAVIEVEIAQNGSEG